MCAALVRYLKGIGPKRAAAFNKIGIQTIDDLLYYFPKRYQDRSSLTFIKDLQEGRVYAVKAQVLTEDERRSFRRRGFSITEAAVSDSTGRLSAVWFNQPYLKGYFKPGAQVILYGKVERYAGKLQMNSPEFELIEAEEQDFLEAGGFVPVYTVPAGITQRYFRRVLKTTLNEFLPKIKDLLPYDIREKNNLLNLAQGLLNIHFPQDLRLQQQAYQRLAFEEFFLFQLPILLRKAARSAEKGISHNASGPLLDSFISALPFELTPAQKKALDEIARDMASPRVMQRLLQGDVGCGKTVVATAACIIAIQGGYQAALMAPTEVLAKQHYEKIKGQRPKVPSLSLRTGNGQRPINTGLLTSSANKKEKDKIYRDIKEGRINLIIGTHALLEEAVEFKSLGLVVIDEQHKFGVGQRTLLYKKGLNPDTLVMTATPIPRTLAITLYGDLDISVIDQLPPGRLPVKTMHFKQNKRREALVLVKAHLSQGNQAYIIYPVIEESYALDMAGARRMYEELRAAEFRGFRIGLIHGRLKQREQDRIMLEFKNKELDLLVSTTVLEVGIDNPHATCMLIEHAHRFGLSQLHQLRGRIGRGSKESACILVSDAETAEAAARMEAMVKYSDGFRIAEEDLKIRGPGEFFGRRQHGLSELRIGNPLTQMRLLKSARDAVKSLLRRDPGLEQRQGVLVKEKLLQRFPDYEKLMPAG